MDRNIDNFYLTVYVWMYSLGLTRSQVLVFAAIHGFTQRYGCYSGSREYLARLAGCTRHFAALAIRRFEELGLVSVSGPRSQQIASLLPPDGPKPAEAPAAAEKQGRENGRIRTSDGRNGTPNGTVSSENVTETAAITIIKDTEKEDNTLSHNGGKDRLSGKDPLRRGAAGEREAHTPSYKKAPPLLEAEFEKVWAGYPRREGKLAAKRAYVAARRSGESREAIEKGVNSYRERVVSQGIEQRYIKQGGNWFREKGWLDGENVFSAGTNGPPGRQGSVSRSSTPGNASTPGHALPVRASPIRALRYPQRRYTREELIAMGVDLGEDVYEDE